MHSVAIDPEDLRRRILAALGGAALGERMAEGPTGTEQLLEVARSIASTGGFDAEDLQSRGLATILPPGISALLLRAVAYGLLSPLDRPLLRRSAHRSARLAGADEGTAMTAVATAVLAADLLRFDVDWCLARLHQTLLEEAPAALLQRLRPLPDDAPLRGDQDPGAALQIAITALHRATTVPAVLDELQSHGEDICVAHSLAGALAGARDGSCGEGDWRADLPQRVIDAAAGLSQRAEALLAQAGRTTTIESPGHER